LRNAGWGGQELVGYDQTSGRLRRCTIPADIVKLAPPAFAAAAAADVTAGCSMALIALSRDTSPSRAARSGYSRPRKSGPIRLGEIAHDLVAEMMPWHRENWVQAALGEFRGDFFAPASVFLMPMMALTRTGAGAWYVSLSRRGPASALSAAVRSISGLLGEASRLLDKRRAPGRRVAFRAPRRSARLARLRLRPLLLRWRVHLINCRDRTRCST
jgi:hypothetical protein